VRKPQIILYAFGLLTILCNKPIKLNKRPRATALCKTATNIGKDKTTFIMPKTTCVTNSASISNRLFLRLWIVFKIENQKRQCQCYNKSSNSMKHLNRTPGLAFKYAKLIINAKRAPKKCIFKIHVVWP